ncbi:hypothetical protein V5799_008759 [Amblyomma americanum]|uniref:Uncharacterized protein n=1 Tax=Amblyomma americanum TaxID=6943 RepID=A0AAQ4FDS5_AMBAM
MEPSTTMRGESSGYRSPSAVSTKTPSPVTSPSQSGTATPGALLSGFVAQDSWSAVQESVYIVIGHGRYQYRVLLCGILAASVSLLHILSDQLLVRPVDHWCRPPDDLRDLSADAWKNMSIPVEADGTFSKCTMYDPGVADYTGANRSVVRCHGWDYEIENRGDSVISRFNLVCDRLFLSHVRGIVAVSVPALLSPLLGMASDNVGRRPIMLMAVFALLVGTVGSSIAQTITFHVFTRVVIFVGFNGTFLLTFILLYEVTGNSWRPLFALTDTAIAGTVVPPFVEAVSALEPRWALCHALLLVPTAMLAAWCCHLDESPAWLLATRDMKQAEVAVIAAAQVNGVDAAKARATFKTIRRQLRKMERSPQTSVDIAVAAEHFLQAAKTHRRAASVFLARFSLSAIYFTLIRTEKTEGLYWRTAEVVLLTASFWAVCWAMLRYNIREALSALLVLVSVGSIVEAVLMSLGPGIAVHFAHFGTKVAVSCAMSVSYCYSAEIFPTNIRSAGVSLCLMFSSGGSLLGVVLVAFKGPTASTAFCAFSAVMAALSVWAIQWLPEVFVEAPVETRAATAMSDEERKDALKKSLAPIRGERRCKRGKRKATSPPKSPH